MELYTEISKVLIDFLIQYLGRTHNFSNSITCKFPCFIGANIFVSSSGLIKLGDFGSAVRLKDPVHTMHGEVCKFRGTAGKVISIFVIIMFFFSFFLCH